MQDALSELIKQNCKYESYIKENIQNHIDRRLQEPSKELVEYAEEHREDFLEWFGKNVFAKMDEATFKAMIEDIAKTMSQQEYANLCKEWFDTTTAGTETNIILGNSKYKRSKSKNPNWIERYRKDKFSPESDKRTKREKQHHLIELLLSKFNLDLEIALILDRALSKVRQKDKDLDDGTRYAEDTGGSYSKLPETIQTKFFEEFIYTDDKDVKRIGYRVVDDAHINEVTALYLAEMNFIDKPEKIDKNPEQYLRVKLGDYSEMSTLAQLHLLKNLEYVESFVLHIKMQHKQDIGNNGRRYNILDEIPRLDRNQISNLFGVDMESALQTIVHTKVKELKPAVELPFTEYYITNKKQVRQEISEQMGWTIDETKIEITAIYQGRFYNPRKHKWHKELEHIFLERDKIRDIIFTTRKENTQVSKYASKRTIIKVKEDKIEDALKNYDKLTPYEQDTVRSTYMFFWWSYFEREVQNIIAKRFMYPKTLHDAVYTQDKNDFDKLDILRLDEEIMTKTGIPIKLSTEEYEQGDVKNTLLNPNMTPPSFTHNPPV